MLIKIYQVDAFTNKLFGGNPAAVCPLESWLDDSTMQKIASENNLSETAFFIREDQNYSIRWFTPKVEVDLCGHATLATAYVIYQYLKETKAEIKFKSRSGELRVIQNDDNLTLDFPVLPLLQCNTRNELILKALKVAPLEIWKGDDYMLVLANEAEVRNCTPDFNLLKNLDARGVIITAKGNSVDFVSRWFGPQSGVDEDPVTGSSHCVLAPYWAQKLGKTKLQAWQLSQRHGELLCEVVGDRVLLSGKVVPYLCGEINI